MANSISLHKEYIAELDRIYKLGALTSDLDVAPGKVKAGHKAGTFLIDKRALVGAGDYSKTSGYPAGDVTLTQESHTYDQDRGRKFTVDAADNIESAMMAFGGIAEQFITEHMAPEIDAYRFATIAGTASIDGAEAILSTAADWVAALNTGIVALRNSEVPDDRLMLYITAAGENLVRNAARDAATTDVLSLVNKVVIVPQTRFYDSITLNAGATGSAGGYAKAAGAEDLNFVLMDKRSCFVDAKHAKQRIWLAEQNINLDADEFQYRIYHDLFVYENKVDGIYVHKDDDVS